MFYPFVYALVVCFPSVLIMCFLLVRRVERGADLILSRSIEAIGLRSRAQPDNCRVRSRGGALRVP